MVGGSCTVSENKGIRKQERTVTLALHSGRIAMMCGEERDVQIV